MDCIDGAIHPAENRQAESRFRDEGVAAKRLEGRACGIWRELIVARNHPDFAAMLQANLRAAKKVARGMESDIYLAKGQRLPITARLDDGIRVHTFLQQCSPGARGKISARTGT